VRCSREPSALNIGDFPTRHNYGLALWQGRIEAVLGATAALSSGRQMARRFVTLPT
jgi:hypothetical protein